MITEVDVKNSIRFLHKNCVKFENIVFKFEGIQKNV
jgi:hypothetical protein